MVAVVGNECLGGVRQRVIAVVRATFDGKLVARAWKLHNLAEGNSVGVRVMRDGAAGCR